MIATINARTVIVAILAMVPIVGRSHSKTSNPIMA